MRTIGNILWHFPFFGFVDAVVAFLFGGFLVITIAGAPLGLGLIELSKFLLTPFSSRMVDIREAGIKQNQLWNAFGIFVRILYFPVGLILAVVTIVQAVGLLISIVGIPVALVLLKSLETIFNPVNKKCVPAVRVSN
jgi:uncharacterized membrane protein YccF (DUF307 family)